MNNLEPVYVEKKMTVAEFLKKYDIQRPSPDEKWICGKKDPLDYMNPTDEVIVVHTKYRKKKK